MIWLPAITLHYGPTVGKMWYDYLNSTYANPTPMMYFTDGSDIVEGNHICDGFRNDPVTQQNISTIETRATSAIKNDFLSTSTTSPTPTCPPPAQLDPTNGSTVFDITSLLGNARPSALLARV